MGKKKKTLEEYTNEELIFLIGKLKEQLEKEKRIKNKLLFNILEREWYKNGF